MTVWKIDEMHVLTLEVPNGRNVISLIEYERQRHLEHLDNLSRIGHHCEIGAYETDHGRDAVSGDHQMIGQIACDLDSIGTESDFLTRLTQGGAERIGIFGLDATPGETDLPRVMLELRGPHGEQDTEVISPINERHQHRRRGRVFGKKLPQASLSRLGHLAQTPVVCRRVTGARKQPGAKGRL